jgi:hypothetical protein
MIDEASVETGEMLLRWDNAPHHSAIPTHLRHKHGGERIAPAARVSIEDVLAELATRLQSKDKVSEAPLSAPPGMDRPWDKAMPHVETWITKHFQELVEHTVATTLGSQN